MLLENFLGIELCVLICRNRLAISLKLSGYTNALVHSLFIFIIYILFPLTQTDIMDLLGSDLPVDSNDEVKFAWSDGILLQVLLLIFISVNFLRLFLFVKKVIL